MLSGLSETSTKSRANTRSTAQVSDSVDALIERLDEHAGELEDKLSTSTSSMEGQLGDDLDSASAEQAEEFADADRDLGDEITGAAQNSTMLLGKRGGTYNRRLKELISSKGRSISRQQGDMVKTVYIE